MFHVPNQFRLKNTKNPLYNSKDLDGNNGYFSIKKVIGRPGPRDKHGKLKKELKYRLFLIFASDGMGWEHVSVSVINEQSALPAWDEMCYVKDLFWDKTDTVFQYHPAEKDYVDNANVLHLWSPTDVDIPTPPPLLVGIKGLKLEK